MEKRLIDATPFEVYTGMVPDGFDENSYIAGCKEIMAKIWAAPTVEAEPVRHAENTTFIDTDDVSKWKSRVMVCERNSHWGRLYYESDTKYGKWVFGGDGCVVCSECDEEEPNNIHRNYCPNCGAKMDLEEKQE